jgi:HEAT repeat protein
MNISSAPQRMGILQRTAGEGKISEVQQNHIGRALRNDESDVVRHEAAFILSALKKQGLLHDDNIALSELIEAFSDKSILVRHEIALSLAAFPCEEAIDALLHHSSDPAQEVKESVRFALVEMLEAKQ